MGQQCFKPKNILKNRFEISVGYEEIIPKNTSYNYQDTLKTILDGIYHRFLKKPYKKNLIARTILKRPIIPNDDEESLNKILKLDEVAFFTDYFTIDELEEFLSSCSNTDSPSTISEFDEEDSSNSLMNRILSGGTKELDNLTKTELEGLLINEKIHLKLAENEIYIDKLTTILRKACKLHLIGEVIDLENDHGNTAISIAIINHNIKGFYYLMFKCQAFIPLYIYEEDGEKTPFLMYFAKYGKIYINNENKRIEYILNRILKRLIDEFPKDYILNHIKEIDPKTQLSLPHYLLSIFELSTDLRPQIEECIYLCIQEYPGCTEIMCVNYYDTRFKFNVIAKLMSNPEASVDMIEKIMNQITTPFNNDYTNILKQLIKVHPDNEKRNRLWSIVAKH